MDGGGGNMAEYEITRPTSPAKQKTPSDLWTTTNRTATTDPVTIAATLFLLAGALLSIPLGIAFIAALPFPLPVAVPVAWFIVYRLPWRLVRR